MNIDDRNLKSRVAKGFRPRGDVLVSGVSECPVEVEKERFHTSDMLGWCSTANGPNNRQKDYRANQRADHAAYVEPGDTCVTEEAVNEPADHSAHYPDNDIPEQSPRPFARY
jgi:hypothetical protein